jgi:hypothetical protein
MSGIEVDTDNLRWFASMVDDLVSPFTGANGAKPVVPASLHPDPNHNNPDIGQRMSNFYDAADLFNSYENYRSVFLGDPGQLKDPVADPWSSSLAAFVSGLQHLRDTATAIADNYDKAQNEAHLGVDQVKALLNADPSAGPTTGA